MKRSELIYSAVLMIADFASCLFGTWIGRQIGAKKYDQLSDEYRLAQKEGVDARAESDEWKRKYNSLANLRLDLFKKDDQTRLEPTPEQPNPGVDDPNEKPAEATDHAVKSLAEKREAEVVKARGK